MTPNILNASRLCVFGFSDQARPDQVTLFLTESLVLKGMAHPNIYPLLGACSDEEGSPLVMYPYTHEGNMKKFLQKCRMSECGSRYVSGCMERYHVSVPQKLKQELKDKPYKHLFKSRSSRRSSK